MTSLPPPTPPPSTPPPPTPPPPTPPSVPHLPYSSPPPPRSGRQFPARPVGRPRRVRNGVKLRATNEELSRAPLAQRWIALLERIFEAGTLAEGLSDARAGQTVSIEVSAGLIDGRVQGEAARPHQTRATMPALDAATWERLSERMAGEAIYVAKLLAGELPPAIEELFSEHGRPLLPRDADDVRFTCTCGAARPCRHAATIGYLFAERLAEEPLIVFMLLGMETQRLLQRLQHARARESSARAEGGAAQGDPHIPESQMVPLPLEACLEDFWRSGPQLAEVENRVPAPHAPHALLRRLGPPPLTGRFPMVGLLASVYDTVAKAARASRGDDD